ncbi:MAG TPA: hypothetical protein VLI39_04185 [Sedimentisphaerales bacterium]|nr:hypothetical protein [Sedimentisphaerales bacterium]
MKNRVIDPRGTTLVELTVAVAFAAVAFAAVMPLFAGVRNSADARWAALEMVQTARVLNEQLGRHLAAAHRVTAVSEGTSDEGYIEFEVAGGTSYRCALGGDGWVRFGPADNPDELVGSVDFLRFVCYDGNDLTHPAVVSGTTRLVTWEAHLRSPGSMTGGKIVRGACGLRAAVQSRAKEPGETVVTYDFATSEPGVKSFAFADEGELQIPDALSTPTMPIESDQYGLISADDGKSHVLQVSQEFEYAQIRLTFEIEEEPRKVSSVVVTWKGRGVNAHGASEDGAAVYIWNYPSRGYELIQRSANTEAETTLRGSCKGPGSGYVGGPAGKTVTLLVVSNDRKGDNRENTLFTDYAKIDVTVSEGISAFAP